MEPSRTVEVSNEEIDWLKLCDSLEELAWRKREEGRSRAPEGEEFEKLMAERIRAAVHEAQREDTPE
ncbi:hypothetical protein [Rubrobacter aplysinae]|uniref:hypothetical protein n=1 Tax=Rubrobacter aplysinae TaxID=909625 RepID=UPI00064BF29B|nr:hypothetical protein [Rubrobacter aplysinae]